MHTMYCKYCPEILSKACMKVLGQNVLPVCAKKIKEEKFKSYNSESAPLTCSSCANVIVPSYRYCPSCGISLYE